jgi:heterodisulfide reductase subunit C
MLCGSGLIGCDYKMMQSDAYERDDLERGPCLTLYSPRGRVTSRFRERVLVEYVLESSIQCGTCTASYPSTSPP